MRPKTIREASGVHQRVPSRAFLGQPGKDRMTGIQDALQGTGPATAKQLVEKLAKAVQVHAAGRDPFDDVTLVGMGRIR